MRRVNLQLQMVFDALMAAHQGKDVTLSKGGKQVVVSAKDAKKLVQKALTLQFAVPTSEGSLLDGSVPVIVDKGAPSIDGITSVFRPVSLGSNRLSWEVSGADKPYVMDEIAPGGTIKYSRLYGSTVTAKCKLYGIGLDVPYEVLYENRFYQFLQGVEDAMDARDRKWAEVHYGLLKSVATTTQNYDNTAPNEVGKVTNTINKARTALIKQLQGKVAHPLDTMLVMNCHYALENKINRALKTLVVSNDNDGVQLTDKVRFYFTETGLDVNTAILSFPQRKSQNALVMDATQNTWVNNDTNGVSLSVYSVFGAICADAKEHIKVNFS